MKRLLMCLAFIGVASIAQANDTVTNASSKLIVACDSSTIIVANSGITRVINGVANRRIYICGYSMEAQSGNSFKLRYGVAGSTCSSGIIDLTGNMVSISSTTISYGGGLGTVLQPSPVNDEFCISNSVAGNQINGVVTWTQL